MSGIRYPVSGKKKNRKNGVRYPVPGVREKSFKLVLLTSKSLQMGNFRTLRVWQIAMDLAVKVYSLTRQGDLSKDYGLRDQLQRSAVSIPSNIAEGDEMGTSKMAIRQFYIAKGSAAELITQLTIATRIGYLDQQEIDEMIDVCNKIGAMLNKLIDARTIQQ